MEDGRWKFSLRDILVGMLALGLCLGLFARWLHVGREESRKNLCINNLKQIGLGLHNHHDAFRKLPALTSSQLYGTSPGSVGITSPASGFSWGARIMPFLEEITLYNQLSQNSNKFTASAFSVQPPTGTGGQPLWSVDVALYRCPSYSGPRFATAKEYVAHSGTDATGKTFGVAVSNYVALTATHLSCATSDPNSLNAIEPNGLIIPPTPSRTSVSIRDVVDGLSTTYMLCESRESGYSSWYDGTAGWVVAADPNGQEPTKDSNGFWVTTAGTSIQLGPWRRTPNIVYLPASKLSTIQADCNWGPSSEHNSRIVNHLIGDGGVFGVDENIDPTLYLQLTTRAGAEPVTPP